MLRWLAAFLLTEVVEVGIYARALQGTGNRYAWALVPSLATHPIVWFGFPRLPLPYWWMVAAAEAFAVAAEALLLWRWGVKRALAWSLLANGLSFGTGLVVRAWLGFP